MELPREAGTGLPFRSSALYNARSFRADSSAGRALRSQCRGREFDPPSVHQIQKARHCSGLFHACPNPQCWRGFRVSCEKGRQPRHPCFGWFFSLPVLCFCENPFSHAAYKNQWVARERFGLSLGRRGRQWSNGHRSVSSRCFSRQHPRYSERALVRPSLPPAQTLALATAGLPGHRTFGLCRDNRR